MAQIQVHRDDIELESPTLVEGFPGIGLVGKIAADHLVDTFGMTHYASCRCEGLPEMAVFEAGDRSYRPPVRIYADAERDLLVLRSDAPVSPAAADEFAPCLTGWIDEVDATPLFLSGLPTEKDGVPELYGVASGDAGATLEEYGIQSPTESGVISGPTGALLYEVEQEGMDAVGLVVESSQTFPDPEAARVLLVDGIAPIADIDVETDKLVEQAEEISEAREQLAKRMETAHDESSKAQPMGMYQ